MNKQTDHISNIMSKRTFTEKFTIFFSNAGKAGNVPGFKFVKFLEGHLLEMI